jgi:hypothetical protein
MSSTTAPADDFEIVQAFKDIRLGEDMPVQAAMTTAEHVSGDGEPTQLLTPVARLSDDGTTQVIREPTQLLTSSVHVSDDGVRMQFMHDHMIAPGSLDSDEDKHKKHAQITTEETRWRTAAESRESVKDNYEKYTQSTPWTMHDKHVKFGEPVTDAPAEAPVQEEPPVVPPPAETEMSDEANDALNAAIHAPLNEPAPEPDLVELLIGHNERLNALFAKTKGENAGSGTCLYHAKIHMTTAILLALSAIKPDQGFFNEEFIDFEDELKAMEDTIVLAQRRKGSDLYVVACAMDELVKCRLLAAAAFNQE